MKRITSQLTLRFFAFTTIFTMAGIVFLTGCHKEPDGDEGGGGSTITMAGTVKDASNGNPISSTTVTVYDPSDKDLSNAGCNDNSSGAYSGCSATNSLYAMAVIAHTTNSYVDEAYLLAPSTSGNVNIDFQLNGTANQYQLTVALQHTGVTDFTGYTIEVTPSAQGLMQQTFVIPTPPPNNTHTFTLDNTTRSLYTITVSNNGRNVSTAWTFTTDKLSSTANIQCNYSW